MIHDAADAQTTSAIKVCHRLKLPLGWEVGTIDKNHKTVDVLTLHVRPPLPV